MIYTITLNPSLDYFATCKDFAIGKTNRTTAEAIYPGGKGINVSLVLRNLGLPSKAIGFLAGFTGKQIKELINKEGIDGEMIFTENGLSRINLKIRSEVETELNGKGPVIDDEAYGKLKGIIASLNCDDVLVLSGSIPSSLSSSAYEEILESLEGKGVRSVVDCTGESLLKTLKYHPFLIKPNDNELSEIFSIEALKIDDIVVYAKKLKDLGAVNVLVSLGEKGAILVDENGVVHMCKAPKGKLVNSIGSGDAMVAGFLYGYHRYNDYGKALVYGVASGSASAFKENFASLEEIEYLVGVLNKEHLYERKVFD